MQNPKRSALPDMTSHLQRTLTRAISTALLETGQDDEPAQRWAAQLTHNAALNIMALASASLANSREQNIGQVAEPTPRHRYHEDARFHYETSKFIQQTMQQEQPWTLTEVLNQAVDLATEPITPTATTTRKWAGRAARHAAQKTSELIAQSIAELRIQEAAPPTGYYAKRDYYEKDANFHDLLQQELYRLIMRDHAAA